MSAAVSHQIVLGLADQKAEWCGSVWQFDMLPQQIGPRNRHAPGLSSRESSSCGARRQR